MADSRSLPSRERGLKSKIMSSLGYSATSLPSRERGLKLIKTASSSLKAVVAPFTGAWIEMADRQFDVMLLLVAPFTGAWIEMPCLPSPYRMVESLPSRERGLKSAMPASGCDRASRSLHGSVD